MATISNGKALITGASTGIGAVYADRLARRGYDLVVVARNEKQLEELAARLERETGRKVEVLQADLTKAPDLRKVEEKLIGDPAIAMLVNNAGVGSSSKFVDVDFQTIDNIIALNVTALTHLAAAAARSFSTRRKGVIINIGSVVSLAPGMVGTTYTGSKAFVLALTESLNIELADSGVRVQAVLPGGTLTEIWQRSGYDAPKLQSTFMAPEEMVDAALAGLDQGELITIPPLHDADDLKRFLDVRAALRPNLNNKHAAPRYHVQRTAA